MCTLRNLKLSTSSIVGLSMWMGVCYLCCLHDQLLHFVDIERGIIFLAPLHQVPNLLPVGCLIVVSNQAYHCCDVCKLDDLIGGVHRHADIGEQGVQERAEHAPEATVLRISVVEVLLPTFSTWCRPVRKFRTRLHRAGFRPRALSLIIRLKGTMVLKNELLSMNSILTWVFLLSSWDREAFIAMAIASSMIYWGGMKIAVGLGCRVWWR
jgi:hypothetical protein